MDVEWLLLGLLKIIVINIVLSGDNAVVIALACRNLPVQQQKKAIFFGSFGAIVMRIILTIVAVWMLRIPYVQFTGGILLIWIAMKLMKNEEGDEHIESSGRLGAAIKTIMIADVIMSLDNVLAVAGAASGNFILIGLGLTISIPLIIWGSNLLMKLMNRFRFIILLGVALLGYTAGEMMLSDKEVAHLVEPLGHTLHIVFPIILAALVVVFGKLMEKKQEEQSDFENSSVNTMDQ
ncbi:TerC family protein [Paenibacillus sediminis]|uniref:YjbE family integral membrane protein n=1 Tax=Paenibacillus sediminis TaxID=664909 RepID=A0ABS4GYC6_9BACL|nr:TerC family protein [Paenibacillus sediminis]MBP1935261.1 YjbE family integral membrane protein [Paenibacillus sediminis]